MEQTRKQKVLELTVIRNRIRNGDAPAILTHWHDMVQIDLDDGALDALINYYSQLETKFKEG